MRLSNGVRAEDIISTVIGLAPHAEISSHIPGRIRLKISLSGLGLIDRSIIAKTIHSIPGVMNQRINLHARSIVIEYDRKLIPYELWELLGQIRTKPELAAVATKLMQFLWS
jgi:hypothetical protein